MVKLNFKSDHVKDICKAMQLQYPSETCNCLQHPMVLCFLQMTNPPFADFAFNLPLGECRGAYSIR